MNVGVRDLKANLSSYLERAGRGEVITVTDRGRPVAMLVPVVAHADVARGVDEGWIVPAIAHGLRPVRRHSSRRSIQRVLDDDRDR